MKRGSSSLLDFHNANAKAPVPIHITVATPKCHRSTSTRAIAPVNATGAVEFEPAVEVVEGLAAITVPPNSDSITLPSPPPLPPCVAVAPVKGTVSDPICKPDGPSDTTVPDIVKADPPGASEVALPMAKPVGFAVKVCPASVKTD